ncbi:nucleopolyhedrovirus P10 family protein [Streptomyces europaeiscabiei]|uniref:nucleopolyhedrovirus P10 family protein n=1 Tax=Streptomyces europaeiscabiei TaxID=146819 RepID=UPI0029A12E69|nr:nucleopolyhedrovirus P10 family protein [Streptomyces europaeiscabiei]MDX2529411.1 nucleopolyhedrovirus P10 family protein [Streptomyces europaeiscabiei]
MTADGWTKAVRRQLALGRLLPLGGANDGAWITERAAETVLRRGSAALRGLSLGQLRISPADSDDSDDSDEHDAAVPPPPSALPPGRLRVTADFAAVAGPTAEPFPAMAARLRTVLFATAAERLGLRVTEVDLRVTHLWEGDEEPVCPAPEPPPAAAPPPAGDDESVRAAAAALSVPGVTHSTRRTTAIGGHIATGPALPRRHILLEVAVTAERRALDTAREVRAAVSEALRDRPSVAVLITAVTAAVPPPDR